MSRASTRRTFVLTAAGGCAGLSFGVTSNIFASQPPADDQAAPGEGAFLSGFPSHDPALAREVVGKSHFDLEAITKLVENRPTLALAVWDWGFGDWESALGAASHVGRRDIAEVLMKHGARADIFTLAMFGQLEAVKAIIVANPGIQRTHGPHGITLLAHARAGGDDARAVVEYLQTLGDADQIATNLPIDPAMRSAIIGTYTYVLDDAHGESNSADPDAAKPCCTIVEQRGGVAFKHEPDGSVRVLFHQGDGRFHPAGAPRVRILIRDGELSLTDGDIALRARREG